jgi:hypothetical protein
MFVSLPSFDFVFDELFRATRGLEPKVCFLELVMQPGNGQRSVILRRRVLGLSTHMSVLKRLEPKGYGGKLS